MDIASLSKEEKLKMIELLSQKEERRRFNALEYYEPYAYQKRFHASSDKNKQRLLMAANRIGKSYSGGAEAAFHLTGLYPDWWEGHRYTEEISMIAGGTTNQKVVEIVQTALLGEASDPTAKGSGTVPKECIIRTSRKAGIPDAVSVLLVKHVSGGTSKVTFQSYEAGKEAWMGTSNDLVWLDEEPPQEIYSQALRSIVDRDGMIYMTFTPESGVTDVVNQFTNDLKDGQFIMNATWDDAPHIKGKVKEQLLAAMPKHEREMRSKGIPVMGSGLVYPVSEDDIMIAPMEIPDHWVRIGGLDFGYDHPTAWVAIAWDRDADVVYIYDCYTKKGETPIPIASDIKHRGGAEYPCAWPHDGLVHDKTSGATLSQMYAEEGLQMLPEKFSNPPDPVTNKSNNSVEAGLMHILDRMKSGRLKVFSNLLPIIEELRMYHRKEGRIVKKFDDALDAMRYAVMSVRFAETPNKRYKAYNPHEDAWSQEYDSVVGY